MSNDKLTDLFGDVIFSYSRAQAIEDGVLVDVSEAARDIGIKYPVAMTHGVWSACVDIPDSVDERVRQYRINMVLMKTLEAARRTQGDRMEFVVNAQALHTKGQEFVKHNLWALCGPGDTLDPVITIMLEGED